MNHEVLPLHTGGVSVLTAQYHHQTTHPSNIQYAIYIAPLDHLEFKSVSLADKICTKTLASARNY